MKIAHILQRLIIIIIIIIYKPPGNTLSNQPPLIVIKVRIVYILSNRQKKRDFHLILYVASFPFIMGFIGKYLIIFTLLRYLWCTGCESITLYYVDRNTFFFLSLFLRRAKYIISLPTQPALYKCRISHTRQAATSFTSNTIKKKEKSS